MHELPLLLDMLDRVHDLVDELERDAWDDALGLCERALQRTERDPRFLSRYPRE